MMHPSEIAGLVLAAAAGGAINAIAGGGTLVTFPALLFFGTEPKIANATSTLALVIGTCGSIYGYRRHLEAVKPWWPRFVPVSILGGLIGSVLLTFTSNKTFSQLVPFLILFATILFLAQGAFKRAVKIAPHENSHPPIAPKSDEGGSRITHHASHIADRAPRSTLHAPPPALLGPILFQLAVAIYGGYFGAGIGILMLASLGYIGLANIYEMNALKTGLGSIINLVAAIWFIFAGLINWPRAAVMTIGALAGYYLGAHYAQRISQQRVRQLITAIGFGLAAVTFYQQFLHSR